MSQLFTNNASGTLSVQAEIVDTTLTLQTSEGTLFPAPTGGDFFIATIEDTLGNLEVVRCTGRAADVLTVVRAQENTTALQFPTGSRVEVRVTAGTFGEFIQQSGDQMTGELDMNNQVLRDPLITDGEARNLTLRGSDGGTSNQLVVPTAGGAPTIGGAAILTSASGSFVPDTRTLTGGIGIAPIGNLTTNRTIDIDIQELTNITANQLFANDEFLVYSNDLEGHGVIAYQDLGVRINSVASTNFSVNNLNLNEYMRFTAGTAVTVNFNTGFGVVGASIAIEQAGAGTVTIAGTATVNSAVGLSTRDQYSVIVLQCVGTNTWTLFGDGN